MSDRDSANPTDPSSSEFLDAVRDAAGTRVSPRQVQIVSQALADADFEAEPETIALIVEQTAGELSKRQRRNGQLWRQLGAALAVRSQDGSPEGQRDLLGLARRASGPAPSDQFLLRVCLAIASASPRQINPRFAGSLAQRYARREDELSDDDLKSLVDQAIRSREANARSRREREKYRPNYNPGRRRWRAGGRRARKLQYSDRIEPEPFEHLD